MAKAKEDTKESELLKISGIGETTLAKLETNGISTLMTLATQSPSTIADMCGISENVARKLIKEARDSLKLGFTTAYEYFKDSNKEKRLTTGCNVFDEMLGGGFKPGHINELYGQYGTGKSNLAHLLVVRALAEDKSAKALYIDTENCVSVDRFKDFARANDMDEEDTIKRINIARAYNMEHQMLLMDEVTKIVQEDKNYKILIVDSLTSHARAEKIGRGELASRQQLLNKHMHDIIRVIDMHNLFCFVTNQVSSSPGTFYGDPIAPVGGNVVGHNSAVRIYLRPSKAGSIKAIVMDAIDLPRNECNYYITKDGISEEEPKKEE